MNIQLSRLHFPVTSLGPGQRIGIWFQGCSIRCPGCISADTWSATGGDTTLERVLEQVRAWLPHADGFTISGGEPFDQPDALVTLVRALREMSSGDILVYSGYPIESLAGVLAQTEGWIDALITDPFEIDASHTRPLRGSDNQRLHLLTALGREMFSQYERDLRESDKSLDVMFDEDGSVWFAGIPNRNDFRRLRDLLTDQGHRVQISADKARNK
ncbi:MULTISPECIES: 4Fe-4S single cluster domain-containing protein [unclassified Caballeronia]|uniref:4Fe-4S single cluster domain-containing protein n=1 Tax=unclassified Caballeronia TaxID=2646786 RepID=UPI00158B2750|nr:MULTISPECIES: 4Fe-4S single cluster domain-containing protein [unclassified Caballeronia]QSN63500.1 radical SAM protein [Caballeronia sp. M1242]